MKRLVTTLLAALTLIAAPSAAEPAADPVVKIINFTADWCPNCRILNPRMEEAVSRFSDGEVELVDLDVTNAKGPLREETFNYALHKAGEHQAAYLWHWYAGVTGIAAIISADNGEPISCMNRTLTTDQIEDRLKMAIILTERARPGMRKPQGPDCPPPMN